MRPSMDFLAKAYQERPVAEEALPWLSERQAGAWQRASAHGLPWRKDEHWKYTSLYNLAKLELRAPTGANQKHAVNAPGIYSDQNATVISWNNGLPLIPNELARSISFSRVRQDPEFLDMEPARASVMQDLNLAFTDAVFELKIADNTKLDKPIYLIHELSGVNVLASPRLHIHVGNNAELDLVDHLVGTGDDNVCNRRLTISVGANSHVRHTLIQQDQPSASVFNNTDVSVARDGHYASQVFDLGGRLSRHDLGISLNGSNAYCSMLAAYLPYNDQHVDHHTLVKHNQPNTHSSQRYNGVAGTKGHGVFNGKVLVQKDAQKITAEQSNQNILLCEHAAVDTKPELEIYADDVKCSHGATVGQLDETALFYLQSRGLGKTEAQRLLVQGFVRDIYSNIRCETLRTWLDQAITTKLDALVRDLK